MKNSNLLKFVLISTLVLSACGTAEVVAVPNSEPTSTPFSGNPLDGPAAPITGPQPAGINTQPTPERQIIKPEEELPQTLYETGLNFTIVPETASTQELISVGDRNNQAISSFYLQYASNESFLLFHNAELNVLPQGILVYSGNTILLPNSDGTSFELTNGSNLLKVIVNGFTYYISAQILTDGSQTQTYQLNRVISEEEMKTIEMNNIIPGSGTGK